MNTLRNLRNRLGRTALTIAGIAIGIFALTVVGALAERLQTIVARATQTNSGVILAFAPHGETYVDMQPALRSAMTTLRDDPRVSAVYPEVILPYALDAGHTNHLGPPQLIVGFPNAARPEITKSIRVATGRMLRDSDHRQAFIGASFAQENHVKVGALLSLYGNSYTVVGVGDMAFTIFDSLVLVSFDDAHALLRQMVPPSLLTQPTNPLSAIYVSCNDPAATADVAHKIAFLTGFDTRDPGALSSDLASTLHIFDSIIFGGAAIALLIASFSIVNTMTISVSERIREIGIRRAIGATDQDIVREFLAEALIIGIIGGVIGVIGGAIASAYFDDRSLQDGSLALFELTPRLAAGAMAFSILVSLAAGLVPAMRAAKLDPVEALRKNV